MKALSRIASAGGWAVLLLVPGAVGLYSMRYALPTVPHPVLTNFVTHRVALSIHAVSSSVALIVGPWQFLNGLRALWIGLHRLVGRVYILAVSIGWTSSIPVALHAETGAIASAGFLALGICWIAATTVSMAKVLRKDIRSHRRWMMRSYALTAAAITLRVYLGMATALRLPFNLAYPAIAWLCWIPNLAIAELALLVVRPRTSDLRRGGTADKGASGAARDRFDHAVPPFDADRHRTQYTGDLDDYSARSGRLGEQYWS